MRLVTVRSTLALLVVGVFMGITAVMALYPILSQTNVELDTYANFFAKTASVYNGIVGVIIGYYFGRVVDTAQKPERNSPVAVREGSPQVPTSGEADA